LTDFEVRYAFTPNQPVQISHLQCLLHDSTDAGAGGYSLCYLVYIAGGVSIGLILVLASVMWARCYIMWYYITPILELAISVLGIILWLGTALVLTSFAAKANDNQSPQQDTRSESFSLTKPKFIITFLWAMSLDVDLKINYFRHCGEPCLDPPPLVDCPFVIGKLLGE
jgi:hypothetical protein